MSSKPDISICIPTWEQYGFGDFFLKKLLETIKTQVFTNYEVVISDHSRDNKIFELSQQYSEALKIKYIHNETNLGNSPHNTNNAIKNADGEIIKIMFQDDFFYDDDALFKISELFKNEETKWVVNGSNHTDLENGYFYNFMKPYWNPLIYKGVNTISSPSVLSFRRDTNIFFDEKLTMLMDCEMYYSLYKKFGLPTIISDTLITNRVHSNQISRKYNLNVYEEIEYVKLKHQII